MKTLTQTEKEKIKALLLKYIDNAITEIIEIVEPPIWPEDIENTMASACLLIIETVVNTNIVIEQES